MQPSTSNTLTQARPPSQLLAARTTESLTSPTLRILCTGSCTMAQNSRHRAKHSTSHINGRPLLTLSCKRSTHTFINSAVFLRCLQMHHLLLSCPTSLQTVTLPPFCMLQTAQPSTLAQSSYGTIITPNRLSSPSSAVTTNLFNIPYCSHTARLAGGSKKAITGI